MSHVASSIISAHPTLVAWGEAVAAFVAIVSFAAAARYARPKTDKEIKNSVAGQPIYDETCHPGRRATDGIERDADKRDAELVEALRLAQLNAKPPGRVVVVEDAKVVREVLQALLEQVGIKTRGAGSIAEALPFVAPDDVLVSDWFLPDGIALELVAKFHEVYPGAPVVLISAMDTKPDNIPAGAIWMSKPFDPDQFIAIVRRLLERKLQV